jgi:anaerobic selenocysteine-containing dehydrogenase
MTMTTTPGLRVVRTMCPMNCHPTLCGMLVEGRTAVWPAGDPDNPDSQGFSCQRGQASREIIGNPHRLLHPLVRRAGADAWRQATWDRRSTSSPRGMRRGRRGGRSLTGHGLAATNYGTRISATSSAASPTPGAPSRGAAR